MSQTVVAHPDLYFVAIGSGDYVHRASGEQLQLESHQAPVNSARVVATTLEAIGARFGIVLLSDSKHAIRRADMRQAIIDLKRRIRSDGSKYPVILFYYCGHGLGDQFSNGLYLAPGDLAAPTTPSQSNVSALMRSTLSNEDVVGSLESFRLPPAMALTDDLFMSDLAFDARDTAAAQRVRQRIASLEAKDQENRSAGLYPEGPIPPVPFVALFDNCYGGVIQDLASTTGAATMHLPAWLEALVLAAKQKAKSYLDGNLAEAQSDGLVLYAARPGAEATADYTDPLDERDFDSVGPLARRLALAVAARHTNESTRLQDLIDAINAPDPGLHGTRRSNFQAKAPAPYSLGYPDRRALSQVVLTETTDKAAPLIETRLGSAVHEVN